MHLLDNAIRSDEMLVKTVDIKHRFYASSSEPLTHKELISAAEQNGDHDLIELFNDHSLGYAENGGSLDVRTEISNLYGDNIGPENIVVFPGAQSGMTIANLALLNKGDHVIIITPSYQSLEEGVKLAGASVTRVALLPEDNWLPDLEKVEAAIQGNTKHIVFNDPHNPSGSLLSMKIKEKLSAIAKKHNILLFSDEVYRLLEIDPADRTPSMAEMTNDAIALSTMSKPWGAGGCCIGWIVTQDTEIVSKLLKAQFLFAVCFSRAGEIQAMMTLRSSDAIVEKNMKIIRDNLALLNTFFKEYEDLFEWMPPQAGGTGFVKFKGPITANELAAQLLDAEILVFGPSIFDCDSELDQYFRIGFSRRTMPASLQAFKEFVDNNKAAWSQ
ncbi:MAG: pyridoxal phosphate-dependent aminotransferase [Emcibacteraceae bacterium]|nr:pyridoxal phosphate-dependent aminotransferase [Emcibacteraceae bacterium]